MKSPVFIAVVLILIGCDRLVAGPPAVETLPPGRVSGPIVIHRKVSINQSLPELGARLYDRVDYELELLELTRDIRIAEAELDVLSERARRYDKYFGRTSALLVTREKAHLDVLRAHERLKVLRQQKLLALRYRNDQIRYRRLLLARGAARLELAE